MPIYVLPTEENMPPRALLFEMPESEALEEALDATEADVLMVGVAGQLATWSRDMGTWTSGGVPLPGELSEAITEHAKSLGVEWD